MINEFKANMEGRNGDWRVIVFNEPWNLKVKIYLFEEKNGKVYIAGMKNGALEMTEFIEGSDYDSKPFLVLHQQAWQALAGTLRQVIPNVEEDAVEAELKATKFHLQDLRRLVFKIPLDK